MKFIQEIEMPMYNFDHINLLKGKQKCKNEMQFKISPKFIELKVSSALPFMFRKFWNICFLFILFVPLQFRKSLYLQKYKVQKYTYKYSILYIIIYMNLEKNKNISVLRLKKNKNCLIWLSKCPMTRHSI